MPTDNSKLVRRVLIACLLPLGALLIYSFTLGDAERFTFWNRRTVAQSERDEILISEAMRRRGAFVVPHPNSRLPRVIVFNSESADFSESDAEKLAALPSLEELDLLDRREIAKSLHEQIDPNQTFDVSDRSLSHLSKLPHLRSLRLSGISISDKGLQHISQIKSLQHLELAPTWLSPFDFQQLMLLSNMHNLRSLDLILPEEAFAFLPRLAEALPNCRIECRTGAELPTVYNDNSTQPVVPPEN